jgi:hypothetical protein
MRAVCGGARKHRTDRTNHDAGVARGRDPRTGTLQREEFTMVRASTYVLVPAALALGAGGLAAQGSFEGVVHYRLTGESGPAIEPVYYVKGGKTRIEMNARGQTVVMLMDVASGSMTTLMPAQRMYITMNVGAMAQNFAPERRQDDADVTIEPTGEKETIAGIACEHYRVKQSKEEGEADLCLAHGMGTFMGVSVPAGGGPMSGMGRMPGLGTMPPGMAELAKRFKDGAFLLKMDLKKSGGTEMSLVATQVERKTLDANLFAPPSDYREMRMPGR